MATLPTAFPTLLDLATQMGADEKIATVIELLNEYHDMLTDITWGEGNLATGHRATIRRGIPTATWRRLNEGVMPSKATTGQITFTCGMLATIAECDAAEADLNSNTAQFRLNQEVAHMEGMMQALQRALIFGDEDLNPEQITGFHHYYNDLSAESAENIIDAGGTGTDNTSIWLVGWSPSKCHGIIPKGMPGGLQREDKGKDLIAKYNADGTYAGKYNAYQTYYEMHAGLALEDWRSVVRVCNIDKSALLPTAASGADLINLMTQALEVCDEPLTGTRPVFYVSRKVRSMLRQQMVSAVKNSTLTMDEVAGKRVLAFDGIPVRALSVLGADEARIV